ncbi:MAG: hypothetical protein COC20_05215 [Cellvibrionales bacterium]|nr:MAG: hypothetical protein COC20_05215 [Cellvibrionales bacterium]
MKIQTPWILIATIAVIALTRLLPHPPNFSPVVAVALFAGAALADRKLAFLVPMAAMFVADLFIGFHDQMVFIYLAMALVVAFGFMLGKNRKPGILAGSAILGSVIFFILSNTGMWWLSGIYPHSADGLLACYVAALPFFHNTVLATVLYSALLFGIEYLLRRRSLRDTMTIG